MTAKQERLSRASPWTIFLLKPICLFLPPHNVDQKRKRKEFKSYLYLPKNPNTSTYHTQVDANHTSTHEDPAPDLCRFRIIFFSRHTASIDIRKSRIRCLALIPLALRWTHTAAPIKAQVKQGASPCKRTYQSVCIRRFRNTSRNLFIAAQEHNSTHSIKGQVKKFHCIPLAPVRQCSCLPGASCMHCAFRFKFAR